MKIEKDAEWLRLEGKVGQLRGDLADAERRLRHHAERQVMAGLGLVQGETVVVYRGKRYIADSIYKPCGLAWLIGRLIKKDGSPSAATTQLFDDWHKEGA